LGNPQQPEVSCGFSDRGIALRGGSPEDSASQHGLELCDEGIPKSIGREGLLATNELSVFNNVDAPGTNPINMGSGLRQGVGGIEQDRTAKLIALSFDRMLFA
jgi:hypothetical protein